jgi:hypothetical protein
VRTRAGVRWIVAGSAFQPKANGEWLQGPGSGARINPVDTPQEERPWQTPGFDEALRQAPAGLDNDTLLETA